MIHYKKLNLNKGDVNGDKNIQFYNGQKRGFSTY